MNKENTTYYSGRELMQALSAGILAADPYWVGYTPPPGFADVLAAFAAKLDATGDESGVFRATLDEVRDKLSSFVHGHPICLAWNRWDGEDVKYKFTSRYSVMPTQREFIDLDAVVQNAMVWLRQHNENLGVDDVQMIPSERFQSQRWPELTGPQQD